MKIYKVTYLHLYKDKIISNDCNVYQYQQNAINNFNMLKNDIEEYDNIDNSLTIKTGNALTDYGRNDYVCNDGTYITIKFDMSEIKDM